MEIISWNIEFWRRVCEKYNTPDDIKNWLNFANLLLEIDIAFILLQEINPFYICDKKNYEPNTSNIHNFTINNKNIYYHELNKKEYYEPDNIFSDEQQDYPFWGAAIIAKKNYTFKKNHNYNEKKYIGEYFYGYETLMCYTFESISGKLITLINYYKKGKNGNYNYEEAFFNELSKVYNEVNNKNIILLAGDFNPDFDIIKKIIDIGFIEKTDPNESTMVKYHYHNDCIFVNKHFSEIIKVKKIPSNPLIPSNDLPDYLYNNFSDHYGFKCIIDL